MYQNKKMKACVLYSLGDMRYEEVDIPLLKNGEVRVKIKAAGICNSDIPRAMAKGPYHYPIILGHEIAGEVVEKAKDVTAVEKRVSIIPLIPCNKCAFCQVGHYAQCENYNFLGSRSDGGFAEYVNVPSSNIVPLPENVSYEEGALVEPIAVALHGLKRANVDIGSSVAVFGAGLIGVVLAQLARISGAEKIFLIDILPKKLEIAQSIGFKDCINPKESDPVSRILECTNGIGVDISVECAGSPVTFNQCIQVTRRLGKIILIGNIEEEIVIPPKVHSEILRKQLTLLGSWGTSFISLDHDWRIVLDLLNNKRLIVKPFISHRYPLSKVQEAFEMIYNRREFFNKVIILPEQEEI